MTRFLKDPYLRAIVLLSIPMLTLTVIRPFGFDNAMYQTMALDLYRFGRVPFIGTWDQNFPGIVYIHYVAILAFGTSDFALRWFDVIVQLLFAVFLYRFWLRWLRPHVAALTAVLYVAYYVSGGGLLLSERDVYAGMLILISIWFILRARENTRAKFAWIAGAGVLGGLNLLLRPTGLLPVAILSSSFLYSGEGRIERRKWSSAFFYLVMSLIPLGLVLAYYAQIPGGLQAFYLATIRWNLDLYARINNSLVLLVLQFARRALLVPIGIYAFWKRHELGVFFSRALLRWEKILFLWMTLTSLLVALLMRKYFDYHFAPFYMLLMPVVALGIEHIASRFVDERGFTRPLARHYAIVIGAYMATFLAYVPKSPFAFGLALTELRNPEAFTYAAQYPDPYWGAKSEWAVERYLNAPTNRTGRVEICSFTTNLQLHLRREPASKYIQLLSLAYRTNPFEDGPPKFTAYQLQWQREYLDSLLTIRPRFLVIARNTHFAYFDDVYHDLLQFIPGFDSLLAVSYRYDTTFGGYQIFRTRSDSIRQE